jgi:Na+-driven multidrug efflux pump
VIAIAFGATPVAGQNFGAGRFERVRETFRTAAIMSSLLMLLITLVCQWHSEWFIQIFTRAPDVVAVGAPYLRIISWNFIATGLIFTCSGLFQALGNTWPSLLSSASRLLTFVVPVVLLSRQPHFSLTEVWYLSVATVTLQALISLTLLLREFPRKLGPQAEARRGAAANTVA